MKLTAVLLLLVSATPLLGEDWKANPVGFFHFGASGELNSRYVRGAPVRATIQWGEYEPTPGAFVTDRSNRPHREILDLLSQGMKVVPAIRAKSAWAVEKFGKSKCSSAPKDLVRKGWQTGTSYSATYYRFVKKIAQLYRGHISIIVIENEMNDQDDMWCSSVDDYLRLFLTAKAAFHDVDPSVQVVDGGIQGLSLNWMVVQDYLERKHPVNALEFYRKYSGQNITLAELKTQLAQQERKSSFQNASALYHSRLYALGDMVNFHYYQRSEALPEVVGFLRKKAGYQKPILTNETGIKDQFTASPLLASQEMVKKYAQYLLAGVGPVIWFSPNGDDDKNAGALVDDNGRLIPETVGAFETISRFLGRPSLSRKYVSEKGLHFFKFRFERETVTVVWHDEGGAKAVDTDSNCEIFSTAGERSRERSVTLRSAPVFLVCENR